MPAGRTVVFRVDGGHSIGLGHVYRSLALAQEMRRRAWDARFVTLRRDGVVDLIEQRGFAVTPLDACDASGWDGVAERIVSLNPDVVVHDIRDTDPDYMCQVRSGGAKVLNFDDAGAGRALAEAVVDANVASGQAIEPAARDERYGPEYIVLSADFAAAHERRRATPDVAAKLLVVIGGSDPKALTEKVIHAADRLPQPPATTVVLGYAFRHRERINALAKRRLHVAVKQDVEDLATEMLVADLAVTSGGVTMYEAAACGTPAVVLCQVPHEVRNAALLEARGTAISLGPGEAVSEEVIAEAISRLAHDRSRREAMSRAGKATVDGRGLWRVADLIEQWTTRSSS